MRSLLKLGAFSLALAGAVQAETFSEMFPNPPEDIYPEQAAILGRLDYKQGTFELGSGFAEIEVGEEYYFLNSWDSRAVLEQLWGNPPSESLGMIFPAGVPPSHAWGIEIFYEPIGYVPDDDAASYDYDDLLARMQADVREANPWRRENGYPAYELIGWAAEPRYDAEGHKLYWAQELQFEGDDIRTLNYNIRMLGRKGVLNLNFIGSIGELPEANAALPDVLAMVRFTEGNRYEDFVPGTDQVADASIGSLISGGPLASAGLIALAAVLLKKFWFVLLLPAIWLFNLFTRRNSS
jgi:uncharacterized membrane-anchored protein